MILGTGHFDNPGRDQINFKVDDVLKEKRQREIAVVVDLLTEFRPSHIALEWPRKSQGTLDTRYRDYREGRYQLSRGEVDQLGLRLAAQLELPKVHAVDWNDYPPGDLSAYDWAQFAKAHGFEKRLAAISDPDQARGYIPLTDQSIGVWLRQLNRPTRLAALHRVYFDIAMIGKGEKQPGANWVGHWYTRNLRIFKNLVRLTDDPEARILVIYGAGHAYLLRQFARESGAFRLIDVAEVLEREK